MGKGLGRRYEFKISSPVAVMLRVWESEWEAGKGGSLDDKLPEDLLLWGSPPWVSRWPSSGANETGLLLLPGLLEVPLNLALLEARQHDHHMDL